MHPNVQTHFVYSININWTKNKTFSTTIYFVYIRVFCCSCWYTRWIRPLSSNRIICLDGWRMLTMCFFLHRVGAFFSMHFVLCCIGSCFSSITGSPLAVFLSIHGSENHRCALRCRFILIHDDIVRIFAMALVFLTFPCEYTTNLECCTFICMPICLALYCKSWAYRRLTYSLGIKKNSEKMENCSRYVHSLWFVRPFFPIIFQCYLFYHSVFWLLFCLTCVFTQRMNVWKLWSSYCPSS